MGFVFRAGGHQGHTMVHDYNFFGEREWCQGRDNVVPINRGIRALGLCVSLGEREGPHKSKTVAGHQGVSVS